METKTISAEEPQTKTAEQAGTREPDIEPLSADEIETIRRRRLAVTEAGKTTKAEDKVATDHISSRLKVAQMEAETRRIEQGEGAPSTAETARSITGALGAFANVITSALRLLAKYPLPSAVFVGLIAFALVAPNIRGSISGALGGIGSGIAGLWDTYITQPAERNANKAPTSVNSSALKDAVGVGRLVSASAGYEGVAVKTNDKGEEICHIYYETTVFSYVNVNNIEFSIDDENKTVTPNLPEQELDVDIPSSSSITYFEDNPDVSFWEALRLCEADAKNEATDNQALISCGQANLRKIVETLIAPVLNGTDYKISW